MKFRLGDSLIGPGGCLLIILLVIAAWALMIFLALSMWRTLHLLHL